MNPSRWLYPADPDPDALVRVFLLHHSGGSAAMYRDWLPLLPSDVAAQCVQLPGRQERSRELPYTDLEALARALAEVLRDDLDGRPYAVFGHSMGALLGYRVTVALEHGGGSGPRLLAVSGWAPSATRGESGESPDDEQILAFMREIGSLPDNPDLLALAMPAMRADLTAMASYRDDDAVVGCPVVSYSGRGDPLAHPDVMRSWERRTRDYLGNRVFAGDHFFVRRHALAITADLVALLRRLADA